MCYGCTLCNECGKLDRMAAAKPAGRYCLQCGSEAEDGASPVCAKCGAPLPPAVPSAPGRPTWTADAGTIFREASPDSPRSAPIGPVAAN